MSNVANEALQQDKYDDAVVGVKSTALRFGESTSKWLMGFSLITATGFTIAGINADQSWPYYMAVLATNAHLIYQVMKLFKIAVNEISRMQFILFFRYQH